MAKILPGSFTRLCLYVNELQNILSGTTIKHLFHADDLQIYLHTTKDDFLQGVQAEHT